MISNLTIRLATSNDAPGIARLSRDRIEAGLSWSWMSPRVLRSIADPHSNVVVALDGARMLGFGIMKYHDDEAHLLLLAVRAGFARSGVGSALVAWLERSARVAGIGQVLLEARASNGGARRFYQRLGYVEIQALPGYYQGRETAVRLAKDLWLDATEAR